MSDLIFLVIAAAVAIAVLAGAIARQRRILECEKAIHEVNREALRGSWQSYSEWRDSRVCLGGCGKRVSDRKRDENGICLEPWITEECCMECWKAGRYSGRSAESRSMAPTTPRFM